MFPFGFSFQEIFILTALLTVAGGYKKQFLQYSYSGGRFVGRAVGFIRQKRDQVFTGSGQRKELDALQQQLQEAMSQMQHIRYDIRSSARIIPSQHQYADGQQAAFEAPSSGAQTTSSSLPFHAADPLDSGQPTFQIATGQGAAQPSGTLQPVPSHKQGQAEGLQIPNHAAQTSGTSKLIISQGNRESDTTPISQQSTPAPHHSSAAFAYAAPVPSRSRSDGTSGSDVQVSDEALAKFNSISLGDENGQLAFIDGVPLIPVTAEAAGKGVKRRGGAHTAADVMEEALAEQLVAKKAASFFKPEGKVDEAKPS